MPKLSLEHNFEGRTKHVQLYAVPAVHFRLPFAEEVNRLCNDPATRLSAIAVELGPAIAAEARRWLKELGVGPGNKMSLPCMLGIMQVNRLLHPDIRIQQRSELLKQQEGKQLNELSPDILKEMLGYSSVRVLYLSPVDSIIEAIRCSLELDIPLYGIDLEETADAVFRSQCTVQDPVFARGNVEAYVRQNIVYAEQGRDEYIDSRREFVIAARLKSVLMRHERVLFTCGLSHWSKIEDLLRNESVKPARLEEDFFTGETLSGFERVVVHPLLAVYHMDAFPKLVKRYEKRRMGTINDELDQVDIPKEIDKLIQNAYREHFIGSSSEDMQLNRRDWEARLDFERLMYNLATVRLQAVPDFLTAITAAYGIMSEDFCRILFKNLIDFDWVKPEDFPDIGVLMASPAPIHSHIRGELTAPGRRPGDYFYIDPLPGGGGGHYRVRIPPLWLSWGPPLPSLPTLSGHVTWPAFDDRMMAMSLHAAELARDQRLQIRTQPFEGSLLDGLQVKTTLREFARGHERYYVYERLRPKKSAAGIEVNPFPIVWILRPGTDVEAKWEPYGRNLSELIKSVREKSEISQVDISRLEWLKNNRGDRVDFFVGLLKESVMSYPVPPDIPIKRYDIRGFLLFVPSFFRHIRQEAVWIAKTTVGEENNCLVRAPIRPSDDNIISYIRNQHGLDLELPEWHITLIRLAIHYAEDTVTVVLPDGLMLPSAVYNEATHRQVQIRVVPLSYFPQQALRELSIFYSVPGYYSSVGWMFPEIISRILSETPDACRRLVPERWLKYGLEAEETVPPYLII
jgi:hypothetical protein